VSGRYTVVIAKQARKQLIGLQRETAERVLQKIEALAVKPRPPDCKKLKGREAWRLRVGDYRVICTVHDVSVVVVVVDVGHRRDIYR